MSARCCCRGLVVVVGLPCRVLQVSAAPVSYAEAVALIVAKDGVWGLVARGLVTKLISNGLSAILFSVMWKVLMQAYNDRAAKQQKAE
jgi:hypothetical protein